MESLATGWFPGLAATSGVAVSGVGASISVANDKRTFKDTKSNMEEKMNKLRQVRSSVEDRFRLYWFPRKKFYLWLEEVQKVERQVEKQKDDLKRDAVKIIPPYKAMTNAINTTCKRIDEVVREANELEDELLKRDRRRIVKLATTIRIANMSPLNKKLEQLLEYLKDETYDTIRVHGDPMTGKTILIQHVNNHIEETAKTVFDIVLWLPASDYKDHDKDYGIVVRFQRLIASKLGLELGDIKLNDLGTKISEELVDTKYLLLLDDFMPDIQLENIGIPRNTNGSKVVFTTYLPEVFPFVPLTPWTEFFNIEIKTLSDGDSWQIFNDILEINGNDTIHQGEIGIIARKVVTWCYGLFSLIINVAEIFKSKRTPESWSDGLQMLTTQARKSDVYKKPLKSLLNVRYRDLEDIQKLCFLFTVLYPEDSKIPIDCLFDCWTTLYGVSNCSSVIGRLTLEHLLQKALLNKGSNKQYVTIDKLYRAAALDILHEHNQLKCLVAEEALLKLDNDDCKDANWISLSDSKPDTLPVKVDCPKLTTLFLQKNKNLETISCSFFKKMNSLLILDLYKTSSKFVLPMGQLKRLKVLYVNGCAMLKEFPFKIEGMDHCLEVLDIRGCTINELPQDVEKLKCLRRLMVSIHEGGTLDPVICKLFWLKELIIDVKLVDPIEVSYMLRCNEVTRNIIEKIDTLKQLTTLKFCFEEDIFDVIQARGDTLKIFVPKQDSLQHILKERNIHYKALQVYIGAQMTSSLESPQYFHSYDSFVLSCHQITIEPVIQVVLSKVKALIRIKDNSIQQLDQIIVPDIHHYLVQKCNKIEALIQTDGMSNLETLVLSECSQLKELQLNKCIKHLEIRECPAIEVINISSTKNTQIRIVLHTLRNLKKVLSDKKWPLMTTLEIVKCPSLTEMPLDETSARELRKITVEEAWWKNLVLGCCYNKYKTNR